MATPREPSPLSGSSAGGLATGSELLASDAARRTVWLTLDGGPNGISGGMNFNGARPGADTVLVPAGWTVRATFTNRDEQPHSARVVEAVDPLPSDAPPPAFPGATTRDAALGVPEGSAQEMTFVADRAGHFLVIGGVPGHAQAGMWIHLFVEADRERGEYRRGGR